MSAPHSLLVRHLGPDDARDYRDIRLAALKNAPDAFGSTYEEEHTLSVEAFAKQVEATTVFGAFLDKQIRGMAGFARQQGRKSTHKGLIWAMFVAPTVRGQGVGLALVEAALKHAATIVEQVTLKVVTDNVAAIALYEAMGFKTYGIEPKALKVGNGYADELLMVRFLDDL
ncbi:GNAT family N-acetyltransferase [Bosea spartocytisi]|nr:GNAT family N-acetyltransferase [Bosea spartocytisi]MCT4471550.1 GNAT family N-acetyltransferase [Bosea spartocytisi]